MKDTCEQVGTVGAPAGTPEQARRSTVIKIETHKTNPCNDIVEIAVLDEPGAGGAHHEYLVYWPNSRGTVSTRRVDFQNGPIKENGTNGLTQEVLLSIVAHRLECFQAGPFACNENARALLHVRQALEALKHRTISRQARGVEGTHQR